jgi:hypothetical protein
MGRKLRATGYGLRVTSYELPSFAKATAGGASYELPSFAKATAGGASYEFTFGCASVRGRLWGLWGVVDWGLPTGCRGGLVLRTVLPSGLRPI